MKKCSRCREAKALTEFYASGGPCKPCQRARTAQWKRDNPERVRENVRRWDEQNPHNKAARMKRRAERLATAPGGPFDPDRPEYKQRLALFGGQCHFCRRAPAAELDHGIPISRGGSNHPSNIFPACFKCNRSKHTKKLWLEWTPEHARKP